MSHLDHFENQALNVILENKESAALAFPCCRPKSCPKQYCIQILHHSFLAKFLFVQDLTMCRTSFQKSDLRRALRK